LSEIGDDSELIPNAAGTASQGSPQAAGLCADGTQLNLEVCLSIIVQIEIGWRFARFDGGMISHFHSQLVAKVQRSNTKAH
jgi:hypothetical protein